MFDLAKKLLMAREINLERGQIKLLGQPVVIFPVETFVQMLKRSDNFYHTAYFMYLGCKYSMVEGFSVGIEKKYGILKDSMRKWMKDLAELNGWGIMERFYAIDWKNCRSIVHVKDSTMALKYGKSDTPVCHALRGFIAGGGTMSFGKDVEVVETSCISMGSTLCEFLVKPLKEFKTSNDPLVYKQLNLE